MHTRVGISQLYCETQVNLRFPRRKWSLQSLPKRFSWRFMIPLTVAFSIAITIAVTIAVIIIQGFALAHVVKDQTQMRHNPFSVILIDQREHSALGIILTCQIKRRISKLK